MIVTLCYKLLKHKCLYKLKNNLIIYMLDKLNYQVDNRLKQNLTGLIVLHS